MKIVDGTMTVDLEDEDPRVARIRAVLFASPPADDPAAELWAACSEAQRDVLVAIAVAREITQAELERALGIDAIALRGRHGGLAKIAKRVAVDYPIRATGGRRESRRFSLEPVVAKQIIRLNNNRRTRRKP